MKASRELPQNKEIELNTIDTIIMDMDGTLYQLDGENGSFLNSTLSKCVYQNLITLIRQRESCSTDTAQSLLDTCKAEGQHYSIFFSNRYNLSRVEYFENVWNIDPAGIVSDFEIPVSVLNIIANQKTLYLLTNAPSIWQKRVLSFLGITNLFERIYPGESFVEKAEIFSQLIMEHNPQSLLSIGDQYHTDIEPAKMLGIQTYHVNSPQQLQNLIK